MKKVFIRGAIVAAFAAIAGYGVYANQKPQTTLSETTMANMEALADQELPSEHRCEGSWDKECCVCDRLHYTYARPTENSPCSHRTGCAHYHN